LRFERPAAGGDGWDDWRTDNPNLVRLYDKLMQRASFADTVPV
jgi:hypothetical protein